MTIAPRYPSLYQLNTRVWLRRLSRERGKQITLAEIDDATIDGFARLGFDWIWLVKRLADGSSRPRHLATKPEWRAEFELSCPISTRTTYAAPASQSPPTRSATRSGVTRRWRSFASDSPSAISS